MDTVMRYQVGDGSSVLVEVDEDTYGVEAVSRMSDGVLEAGQRLESALGSVLDAAQATLDTMKKLSPETVEVEFGIKLAGEAGALIARASAEGHFTVRLKWSPGDNDNDDQDEDET
jgi:Trypsin-co-occurring domain 1